jgi:hypothetical protein
MSATNYTIGADSVTITGTEDQDNSLVIITSTGTQNISLTAASAVEQDNVGIAFVTQNDGLLKCLAPLSLWHLSTPPTPTINNAGSLYYNSVTGNIQYTTTVNTIPTLVQLPQYIADANSTYITQTADVNLPNSQSLSTLASGIVTVTNSTGVLASTVTPTVTSITIEDFPVANTDGVNKAYVQALVAGLTFIAPALVTTGTSVNLSATYLNGTSGVGATLTSTDLSVLIVDGVTLVLNDRVLVAGQSTLSQNGVYYLSQVGNGIVPWILTRTTDYDDVTEIKSGTLVPVLNGVSYSDSSWLQVDNVVTVGTDPIQFIPFTSAIIPVNTGKIITFAMSPYTILSTDYNLSCDTTGGPISLTVPDAAFVRPYQEFKITDQGGMAVSNPITLSVANGGNINGLPTYTLNNNYQSTTVSHQEIKNGI